MGHCQEGTKKVAIIEVFVSGSGCREPFLQVALCMKRKGITTCRTKDTINNCRNK